MKLRCNGYLLLNMCQDPPRFGCVRCAIAVYWPIQIKTNDVRGMWYAGLRKTNYVSFFEVEILFTVMSQLEAW